MHMRTNNYFEWPTTLRERWGAYIAIAKGNRALNAARQEKMEELMAGRALAEERIVVLEEKVKALESRLTQGKKTGKEGMTNAEMALAFYYLFDGLGLNFINSHKTQWARFIHRLTGRSFNRLREAFVIDFDREVTRKYLRNVAALFSELFPDIKQKILNDLDPL